METCCLVVAAAFDLQILSGVVQSTGWPGVVTVVGNWFGRRKRGTRRYYVEVNWCRWHTVHLWTDNIVWLFCSVIISR
jgi:sugar phosphate permease